MKARKYPYKVAVNFEWTSKCNARCSMCPQHVIQNPQLMTEDIFHQALSQISTNDVFRTVIAGYGEPTTHPHFMKFVSAVGDHPGRFDLVSNGQLLDEEKLKHIDGKIELLTISFSSIKPEIYKKVHVNLDHETVKANIELAKKILQKTALAISLTPLVECIETLPETIEWFQQRGIEKLTMSPTLYNRAGNMEQHKQASHKLREIIKRYKLHSQELDFVPSIRDIAAQYSRNQFKCMPRNSDLFIASSGRYLFCYNDIAHEHQFSHVNDMGIREALEEREKMAAIDTLCQDCNMRNRYRGAEVLTVVKNYMIGKATTKLTGDNYT
ncbi:MAG: radical SAM protein [Gammaproteobacteria bacterium]|nr:MAG: radical SAM protein [Gammaproteobacteria bacterium]